MLTVACLLKSGGDFLPEHVDRLQGQVQKYIAPTRFVCLSDIDVPCERIPLKHGWKRWWGQCELFRPYLFNGPVLYMDLDTTVLADPGIAPEPGEFWSLGWRGKPTSGVMAWNGEFSHIYEATKDTNRHPERWVNEGIFPHVNPILIQDRLPGFYSYKRDIRGKKLPDDARVVFFHGTPRPWQVKELAK